MYPTHQQLQGHKAIRRDKRFASSLPFRDLTQNFLQLKLTTQADWQHLLRWHELISVVPPSFLEPFHCKGKQRGCSIMHSSLEKPSWCLHKQEGSQCCNKPTPKPNQADGDWQDRAVDAWQTTELWAPAPPSQCTAEHLALLQPACAHPALAAGHQLQPLTTAKPQEMFSMAFPSNSPNHGTWEGLITFYWLFMKSNFSTQKAHRYNFSLQLF